MMLSPLCVSGLQPPFPKCWTVGSRKEISLQIPLFLAECAQQDSVDSIIIIRNLLKLERARPGKGSL